MNGSDWDDGARESLRLLGELHQEILDIRLDLDAPTPLSLNGGDWEGLSFGETWNGQIRILDAAVPKCRFGKSWVIEMTNVVHTVGADFRECSFDGAAITRCNYKDGLFPVEDPSFKFAIAENEDSYLNLQQPGIEIGTGKPIESISVGLGRNRKQSPLPPP
jgi:hypothetical protein